MNEERFNRYLNYINREDCQEIETLRFACTSILFDCKLDRHNQSKIETIITAMFDDHLFMYRNFPSITETIESLYVLLNGNDCNIIKEAFLKLYNTANFKKTLATIYDIYEEKLKYEYANNFAKYYTPNGSFVDQKGNNYPNVVDITNEDFLLNIHNINVGFADIDNARQVVETPGKFNDEQFGNSNTISGALLSPHFIGLPIWNRQEDVYYGFNRLTKNDILAFGNEDMMTEWNVENRKPWLRYENSLYTPDNLFSHIKWKWGESVIWRSTQGHKRKPNYILCIDEINENSLKHAEYYSIPIYYISSIEVIKNKLTALIQDLENLRNSPVNLYQYEVLLDKLRSFAYQLYSLEHIINLGDKNWQRLIIKADRFYKIAQEHIEQVVANYNCEKDNNVDKTRKAKVLEKNAYYYPHDMFKAFIEGFERPYYISYYDLPYNNAKYKRKFEISFPHSL